MNEDITNGVVIEEVNKQDTVNINDVEYRSDAIVRIDDITDDEKTSDLLVKPVNSKSILRSRYDFLTIDELTHTRNFYKTIKRDDVRLHVFAFLTHNPAIINSREELLRVYGADDEHLGLLGIIPSFSNVNDENETRVKRDGYLIIFEVPQLKKYEPTDADYDEINSCCKSFDFLRDVYFDKYQSPEIRAWLNAKDISYKLMRASRRNQWTKYIQVFSPFTLVLHFITINVISRLHIQNEGSKELLELCSKCESLRGLDKVLLQNAKFSQIVLEDFARVVKDKEKSKLKPIDKSRFSFYKNEINNFYDAYGYLRFQGVGQTNFNDFLKRVVIQEQQLSQDNILNKLQLIDLQFWLADYLNTTILYNTWFNQLSGTLTKKNKIIEELNGISASNEVHVIDQQNIVINQKDFFYDKLNSYLEPLAFLKDFAQSFDRILSLNSNILVDTFKKRTLNVFMTPNCNLFKDEGGSILDSNVLDSLVNANNKPKIAKLLGLSRFIELTDADINNNKRDLIEQNNEETLTYIANKFNIDKTLMLGLEDLGSIHTINSNFSDLYKGLFDYGFIQLSIDIDNHVLQLPAMYHPLTGHIVLESYAFTYRIANAMTANLKNRGLYDHREDNLIEALSSETSINFDYFFPLLLEYEDLIKNNDAKVVFNKLIELPEVKFVAFVFRQIFKAIKQVDEQFLEFLKQKELYINYIDKKQLKISDKQKEQIITLNNSDFTNVASEIKILLDPCKKTYSVDNINADQFEILGAIFESKDELHIKKPKMKHFDGVANEVISVETINNQKVEVINESSLDSNEDKQEFEDFLKKNVKQTIVNSVLNDVLDFRIFYFKLYTKQLKRSKLIAERNKLLRDVANIEKEITQFDILNKQQNVGKSIESSLEIYQNQIEEKFECISKQLVALKNIPKIEQVIVNDDYNYLTIVLKDHTYVKDTRTGWEYDLGKLQISVPFSLKNEMVFRQAQPESIRWSRAGMNIHEVLNLNGGAVNDPTYGPYAVIHGKLNGEVCLGDSSASFRKAFSSGNLAMWAMIAIQYAESMNENDLWGQRCHYWCKLKPLDLESWFNKFVIGKDIRTDKDNFDIEWRIAQTLLSTKKLASGLDEEKFKAMSDSDIESVVQRINEADNGLFSFKYFPNITFNTWNNMFEDSRSLETFTRCYKFKDRNMDIKKRKKDIFINPYLSMLKVKAWKREEQQLDKYPLYGRYHGIQNINGIDKLREKFHIALFKSNSTEEFANGFVKPLAGLYTKLYASNSYNINPKIDGYKVNDYTAHGWELDLRQLSYDAICELRDMNGPGMPIISCFDLFEDGSNFTVSIVTTGFTTSNSEIKVIMGFLTEEDAKKAGMTPNGEYDMKALDNWIDKHSDMIIEKVPIFCH